VGESFIIAAVAGNVAVELRRPVLAVRPWLVAVLWAAVPKAAVDKDDDAQDWKSHITPTPETGRAPALPESQTASM
jgi:hypothetical protein